MRANLHPILLIVAAALAQGVPQQAPPAAAQNDAAALTFLRTVVDRRVYSLEGAGVARLSGTAHVTFEVIVPDPKIRPTALDLELACDFASGLIVARPVQPPTGDQIPIAPMAINAAQNAFSLLPSRAATGWTTTLAQDGELFRIDYRPRQSSAGAPAGASAEATDGAAAATTGHWSEWHQPDGTPMRRRVASFRPVGEATEAITQEIVPTFEEKSGKLLLTALKPGDSAGRFSYAFEYAERDGLFVLKKLVQSNEGWRLTLEFKTKVERPAAK